MSWRLVLRIRIAVLLLVSIAAARAADPQPIGRRRALLIGINDYTASQLGQPRSAPFERRDWPNLSGATNDVSTLREMLIDRYGFESRDVITLTDQAATRDAIFEAIDRHLLKPAAEGDVLFFYFAGHGSQVRNTLSDEPDRLDESFVPADSRLGALDIRDKELRPLFNHILDRGAHLTVMLDACHSGSGVRGRSHGRNRSVRRDERDIADGTIAAPRPEDQGALVLSAAQDYDRAFEMRDQRGRMHGAFSWAWIWALRDAAPTEPVEETFLRAQAVLRAEMPFQEPVLAGNAEARRHPFLGADTEQHHSRAVVAVERVRSDGTVVLQGGWANGLSAGSELGTSDARLTVTSIISPARSEARVDTGSVHSGQLVEVSSNVRLPWQFLESQTPPPYRLVIEGGLLVLRAISPQPPPRHYYALAVDGDGRCTLVYPRSGSVENRFPLDPPSPEISLGPVSTSDQLFLLATDEPLPNPWILERMKIQGRRRPRPHKASLVVSTKWPPP